LQTFVYIFGIGERPRYKYIRFLQCSPISKDITFCIFYIVVPLLKIPVLYSVTLISIVVRIETCLVQRPQCIPIWGQECREYV
jgi:hypothetical protein